MKRKRGAVLVFVVVLVGAIAAVWAVTADLVNRATVAQRRRETATIAELAMDGAVAKIRSDYGKGLLALPLSLVVNLDLNSLDATVKIITSDAGRRMRIDLAAEVGGVRYAETRWAAIPNDPRALDYALFGNTGINLPKALTTGSSGGGGDMAANGDIVLSNPATSINGDVESTGAVNVAGTVNGTKLSGAAAVPFPGFLQTTYSLANPTSLLWGLLGFGLYFDTPYKLYLRVGGLSVAGELRGTGTVYVAGDLNITGDLSYHESKDRVAFIVEGNVNVSSGVKNLVGYYFVRNAFNASGAAKTLQRGAIAANALNVTSEFTANYDPAIYNDPSEGARLRLPGYWP